jgi:hypothetical protein
MFPRREIEERLHARENLLLIHLLQNKKPKKPPKTKIPDPCTAPKTHTHTDQTTKGTMPKKPPKTKTEKTQQRKCDLLQPTNIPNTNLQQKQNVTKARRGFFLFP